MTNLFDDTRIYVLGDSELSIIGNREKLAQWRHRGCGPSYYTLGRKIVYRGSDLNAWVETQRVATYMPNTANEVQSVYNRSSASGVAK